MFLSFHVFYCTHSHRNTNHELLPHARCAVLETTLATNPENHHSLSVHMVEGGGVDEL
jgi:hypothetical protein